MSDGFWANIIAPAFETTVDTYNPGRRPAPTPRAPRPAPVLPDFDYGSVPGADLFTVRPQPSDWPYGPYGWTLREKERIAALPIPPQPSNYPYGPAMWRSQIASGLTPSQAVASAAGSASGGLDSGLSWNELVAAGRVPYTDRFGRPLPEGQRPSSLTGTPQPSAGDWADLIAALGVQDGGGGYTPVGVDRSLFRLAETPEEQAMLASELADIEARRDAGSTALRAGWSQVADTNRRAAEKARSQVLQYGDAAAAGWTDAARRAQELAQARAQQAGAFEGRQAINVSPTAGAEDFIMFMQSQAPAARQYAESMQGVLAEDLDWQARTAAGQGEAYSADLQRQANMLAFERAREHNRAVQERIAAERMALADMEFRAATTNAQLAQAAAQQTGQSASQISGALQTALFAGDAQGPAVLASLLGLDARQALALYNSAKSSPLGVSLQAQAAAAGR